MMKTSLLTAAACAFFAVLTSLAGERLVVADGYQVPARWERKPFCGKDFFPVLMNHSWAAAGATNVPSGFTCYAECGWRADGRCPKGVKELVNPSTASAEESILGLKKGEKPGYAAVLPEEKRRTKPYTLHDMFELRWGKAQADRLYSDKDLDRPILLSLGERPAFRLQDRFPLADRDDFAKWKAAHPNYLGNYSMLEFDSDLTYYFIGFGDTKDPEAFRRLQSAYPCTFWDYACDTDVQDRWIRTALERSTEFYFGERKAWAFSSRSPGMIPLFAAAGCAGVTYEVTTQGMEGNWRFAAPYLRGAARQFGIPYGWYTASFYDGFRRGGEKRESGENSLNGPVPRYSFFGLNRGASFPIIDRQNAYGWLIGALYVEVENWYTYHAQTLPDGRKVPSSAAQDFENLYRLSKREDRGQCYAPLALLMPIHEKVERSGGTENFTTLRPGAALYTLVPGDPGPDPLRKRGVEGGFYNSEFADFFDVVCPDESKEPGRVSAALKPYKAAVMLGRYRNWQFAYPEVRKYAEEGGTLVLSCDYIDDQLVDPGMCGVSFRSGRYALSGEKLVLDDGRETPLAEQYNLRLGKPSTAKVLWTDEKGTPVAYVNAFGKGKVVTVAAEGMMPVGWDQTWGIRNCRYYHEQIGKIRRGEVKFGILREIFRRIQRETMPFEVKGDIHWGVNKVKVKGEGEGGRWLLWMFNNKGITNYIGEAPIVDRGCDVTVTVRPAKGVTVSSVREIRSDKPVASSAEGFTVTVPAGGWAAYAVQE